MGKDCIFCKIVAGDIPSETVFENDDFIVIKDVNPQVDGHCLVIPKRHCDSFLDMDIQYYDSLFKTVRRHVMNLNQDFNLIVNNGVNAGQVVKHFHLHILPRKEGDGFKW